VDIDAFVAAHSEEWERLDRLVRRSRRLDGAEVDDLVDLYQRVATQLSMLRSSSPDPALVSRLSSLVARARAAVTGAHVPAWREVARFLTVSFPAVVYRSRWWWLGAAAGSVLVAVALGVWLARSPDVQAQLVPASRVRQLVDHDFAGYYSEYFAGSFAANVWTNNVMVSAIALVFGVLLGVPTLYVLFQNAVNIGLSGGLMFAYGKGGEFFALILPHGLLELTAVFLAGGVGLRLGWTIIDPGPRRRAEALAQEGRAAIGVALGLVLVLGVSGVIEAFVTPSSLPTWARIGIGAVAWAAFVTYALVLGRRAVRAGETGDQGVRPDLMPTAG
jgi:uncharacterized membrane protein SpoIIM required for sporulation